MWPFSKKNDLKKPAIKFADQQFNFIKEAYPVGREFKYLGVRMRVSLHVQDEYNLFDCDVIDRKLVCDYVDKKGVLHTWKFYQTEFQGLLEMKEREDKAVARKQLATTRRTSVLPPAGEQPDDATVESNYQKTKEALTGEKGEAVQ